MFWRDETQSPLQRVSLKRGFVCVFSQGMCLDRILNQFLFMVGQCLECSKGIKLPSLPLETMQNDVLLRTIVQTRAEVASVKLRYRVHKNALQDIHRNWKTFIAPPLYGTVLGPRTVRRNPPLRRYPSVELVDAASTAPAPTTRQRSPSVEIIASVLINRHRLNLIVFGVSYPLYPLSSQGTNTFLRRPSAVLPSTT